MDLTLTKLLENVVLEHTSHMTWAVIMTRPHLHVLYPNKSWEEYVRKHLELT